MERKSEVLPLTDLHVGGQNFTFTMLDGLYLISNKISRLFPPEKDLWLSDVTQKHEN